MQPRDVHLDPTGVSTTMKPLLKLPVPILVLGALVLALPVILSLV